MKMFRCRNLRVRETGLPGVFDVCFDRPGETVNRLDPPTLLEFRSVMQALSARKGLRGVLITSAKESFGFSSGLAESALEAGGGSEERLTWFAEAREAIALFEDLNVPTVAAINGIAFGAGLELAFAASMRVMSTTAQIGLPGVGIGLVPGWGGASRLARIAGPTVACDWLVSDTSISCQSALTADVVDAISVPMDLRITASVCLIRALHRMIDWRAKQELKRVRISMTDQEHNAFLKAVRRRASRREAPNDAAKFGLRILEKSATLDRVGALELEAQTFEDMRRRPA